MIEIERIEDVKQECSCCGELRELIKITISTGQGGMGVGIRICDKCAMELRTRIDSEVIQELIELSNCKKK